MLPLAVASCGGTGHADRADRRRQRPTDRNPARTATSSASVAPRWCSTIRPPGDPGSRPWRCQVDGFRLVDNWADVAPPDPTTDDSATKDEASDPPPTCRGCRRTAPACRSACRGPPTTPSGCGPGGPPCCGCWTTTPAWTAPRSSSTASRRCRRPPVRWPSSPAVPRSRSPPAAGVGGDLPPIEYQVDNGRGGTATAHVQVSVVPADESDAAAGGCAGPPRPSR